MIILTPKVDESAATMFHKSIIRVILRITVCVRRSSLKRVVPREGNDSGESSRSSRVDNGIKKATG